MQQQLQITCPYNSQHIMHPDRLIFHLSNECQDSIMHKTAQNNIQDNFLKIFRGQLQLSMHSNQEEQDINLLTQMDSQDTDCQFNKSISKINQENQSYTQNQIDNQFIDQFKSLNLQYQNQNQKK